MHINKLVSTRESDFFPEKSKLLTIDEVIDRLGIGRTSLYQIFARGEIVPVKVLRRTLVRERDLEQYISNLPRGVF